MSTADDGKDFGQLDYPTSTIYMYAVLIFADGSSQSTEMLFVVNNFADRLGSRDHAQTIRSKVPVRVAEIPSMCLQ